MVSHFSAGKYEHGPVTSEDAAYVKGFYLNSRHDVLGVGRRVGDLWIAQLEK